MIRIPGAPSALTMRGSYRGVPLARGTQPRIQRWTEAVGMAAQLDAHYRQVAKAIVDGRLVPTRCW
jgi:hypothetical protein